jgi:hypothetical protein
VIEGSVAIVEVLDDEDPYRLVVGVVNNDVRYDGKLPMVDIDSSPGFNGDYRPNRLTPS